MIASLKSETPQNAERGIETGIPFEVDSRISTDNDEMPTSRYSCACPDLDYFRFPDQLETMSLGNRKR
jgi:hypothetical protein